MIPESAVFDLDGFLPFLHLGPISLPTYHIWISLTFSGALLYWLTRARDKKMSSQMVLDLSIVVMALGFIGGRVAHVIFEDFAYYRTNPSAIFQFWNGGFVFYGGALLAGVGCFLLFKLRKESARDWLDLFAPVGAIGYASGRIACWLTGCCFGSVCDLSDRFSFQHPTQLYAAVWEVGVFALLLVAEKRNWIRERGGLFFTWVFFHAIGRIIMEAFRADDRGAAPLGISISTWVSLILISWCAKFWLKAKTSKRHSKNART